VVLSRLAIAATDTAWPATVQNGKRSLAAAFSTAVALPDTLFSAGSGEIPGGTWYGSREPEHCCSHGAGPATVRISLGVGRYRCAADDEMAGFV
jgi:hypothetical protein